MPEERKPTEALAHPEKKLPARGRKDSGSIPARSGNPTEPKDRAKYLRAALTFLKDFSEEQIRQIPVLGPALSGASAVLLELSTEEDAEALEGKIERLLAVGEQSRADLEALSALAAALYLQQESLLVRLQAEGLPAASAQVTEQALSAALTAYRGRVAQDYQYADYRGIEGGTRAEHAAALPLDDIYVIPRLVPERAEADHRDRERTLLKELLDNQDLAPADRIRMEEEFAIFTGERWRATQIEATSAPLGEVLAPLRHAVVIGGPGTGKSALTRYLARSCALGEEAMLKRLGWAEFLIPVVVPLAAYADARASRKALPLRDFVNQRIEAYGGDVLRDAISVELAAGRVFLLLDGVDEIPDSRDRAIIVQAVERYLADHVGNRALVTSRPYGYVRLAGDIPHFQLAHFSSDQVETFLTQWQSAFERWRHPDSPNLEGARVEAAEMISEIGKNPKVTELATNPLMLVILALIRHEQTRLPEERVQLYNRAINTLMDTWNRGRSLAGVDVGGARLPLDRMVRVWGAVAEWTRRTRPTGVVHRAELKRKLVQILVEKEYDEDQPEATAESYLNAAADRAGLLEERGRDVFAFWHPTFEEFLAAVELATPSALVIDRLIPLRDDPRWREVILLAVGYLGIIQRDGDTATALVEAIWLQRPSPLEPVLHSHLLLASSCIADDVGIKRSLAERIIIELAKVSQWQPYRPFTDHFQSLTRAFWRLRPSKNAIECLGQVATGPNPGLAEGVAILLGNVLAESVEARLQCESLLKEKGATSSRSVAALAFLRNGEIRDETLKGFRELPAGLRAEMLNSLPPTCWKELTQVLGRGDASLKFYAAEWLLAAGKISTENAVLSLEGAVRCECLDSVQLGELLRWMQYLDWDVPRFHRFLLPYLKGVDRFNRLWVARFMFEKGGMSSCGLFSSDIGELLLTEKKISVRFAAMVLLAQCGSSFCGSDFDFLDGLSSEGSDDDIQFGGMALLGIGQFGGHRVDVGPVVDALSEWVGDDKARILKVAPWLPFIAFPMGMTKVWEFLGRIDPSDVMDAMEGIRQPGYILLSLEWPSWLYSADLGVRIRWLRYISSRELGRLDDAPDPAWQAWLDEALVSSDTAIQYSAARAALRFGKISPQVTNSLTAAWNSTLIEDKFKLAVELLQVQETEMLALEYLAKVLTDEPWAALSACSKLSNSQPLNAADGEALSTLTRLTSIDAKWRTARQAVFSWIQRATEATHRS